MQTNLVLKIVMALFNGYLTMKGVRKSKRDSLIAFVRASTDQVTQSAKLRRDDLDLEDELEVALANRRAALTRDKPT